MSKTIVILTTGIAKLALDFSPTHGWAFLRPLYGKISTAVSTASWPKRAPIYALGIAMLASLILANGPVMASITCSAAVQKFVFLPPGGQFNEDGDVTFTVWFPPSSSLDAIQFNDPIVTFELNDLSDPSGNSTSKESKLPKNGVVEVIWSRDELDKLFSPTASLFGVMIKISTQNKLKKAIIFGPGRPDSAAPPPEAILLNFAPIRWTYVVEDETRTEDDSYAEPTECKDEESN